VWDCFLFSDGTPYAGGLFCVKLVLGKSFPTEPPKGFFLTKIFHPNVAKNGEICVNTLKKDWKSDYGVKHILLVCTLFNCTVRLIGYIVKGCVVFSSVCLLISVASLGVLLFFVVDSLSVRLWQTLLLFCFSWNWAIFGPSVHHDPSTKRCSYIFDLGPVTPKIYSPKFAQNRL